MTRSVRVSTVPARSIVVSSPRPRDDQVRVRAEKRILGHGFAAFDRLKEKRVTRRTSDTRSNASSGSIGSRRGGRDSNAHDRNHVAVFGLREKLRERCGTELSSRYHAIRNSTQRVVHRLKRIRAKQDRLIVRRVVFSVATPRPNQADEVEPGASPPVRPPKTRARCRKPSMRPSSRSTPNSIVNQ